MFYAVRFLRVITTTILAYMKTCLSDHSGSAPAAESLDYPPDIALGNGYPESKWVTEQLFRRAAERTGLRTTSVRVGQVSGDERAGGWSTSEWVPALVRVSQRLGRLPSRDEVCLHELLFA